MEFYPFLVESSQSNNKNSLFCHLNDKTKYFLICKESPYRSFCSFENHIDFCIKTSYLEETTKSESYYEIINEKYSKGVKPYFDIDINNSLKKDKVFYDNEVLKFKKYLINFFDRYLINSDKIEVNIYDSSNNESDCCDNDLIKISYHIVINGIYFYPDFNFIRSFMKDILIENYSKGDKFKKCIDTCVYKNNQQFRLLWSSKYNESKRFKRLFGEESRKKNRKTFESSLITFTNECSLAVFKEKIYKKITPKSVSYDKENIDIEELKEFISLEEMKIIEEFIDKNPFEIKDLIVSSNDDEKIFLIILRRHSESYCEVCKREHNNENPFIIVKPNNTIKFNCRRNEEKKYLTLFFNNKITENIPETIFQENFIKNEFKKIKEIKLETVIF